MHSWVRSWCEKHKTERRAEGYLLETYDDNSGWSIGVFDSLYHPVRSGTGWNCGKRYSALNGHPLMAEHGYLRYNVSVMGKDEAITYMAAELKKKLVEDGFTGIRLEKAPCYEVYDKYTAHGGFLTRTTYTSQRVTTKNLLGYALKFHVEW